MLKYLLCLVIGISLTTCFDIPPPYSSNVGETNEAPIIRVTHEYDHVEGSVSHINDIIIYDSDGMRSPEALVQLSLLPKYGNISFSDISTIRYWYKSEDPKLISVLVHVQDLRSLTSTIIYKGSNEYKGNRDEIEISLNDRGYTGTGGAKTAKAIIIVNLKYINKGPKLSGNFELLSNISQASLINLTDRGYNIIDEDINMKNEMMKLSLTSKYGYFIINNNENNEVIKYENITNGITITNKIEILNNYILPNLSFQLYPNVNSYKKDYITFMMSIIMLVSNNNELKDVKIQYISVNRTEYKPIIEAPFDITIDEDSQYKFDSFKLSDENNDFDSFDLYRLIIEIDYNNNNNNNSITTTITTTTGKLQSGILNGLHLIVMNNSYIEVEGQLENLNTFLHTTLFIPNENFYGSTEISLILSDYILVPVSIYRTINIEPVNDAPIITTRHIYNGKENQIINLDGFSVSDIDCDLDIYIEIQVNIGTIGFKQNNPWLTYTKGNGNGNDQIIALYGTMSTVNQVLKGLIYYPVEYFNFHKDGRVEGIFTVNDNGRFGKGGIKYTTTSFYIVIENEVDNTILNINNNNNYIIDEDTELKIEGVNVIDNDVQLFDDLVIMVELQCKNGKVIMKNYDGLYVMKGNIITGETSGSGDDDDTSIIFRGSISSINNGFKEFYYQGNKDYYGKDEISIKVTNLEKMINSPEKAVSNGIISIEIEAVNDPPVIVINTPYIEIYENESTTIQPVIITDVDARVNDFIQLNISTEIGSVKIPYIKQVNYKVGKPEVFEQFVSLECTKLTMTKVLDTFIYKSKTYYSGRDSIEYSVNDLGATGKGGFKTAKMSIIILIYPVNNPPIINAQNEYIIETKKNGYINRLSNISINDIDYTLSSIDYLLTVTIKVDEGNKSDIKSGTISLGNSIEDCKGLFFRNGSGFNDSYMVFDGNIQNINNALNNMIFNYNLLWFGLSNLYIKVSDNGYLSMNNEPVLFDEVNITLRGADLPIYYNYQFEVPITYYTTEEDTILENITVSLINLNPPDKYMSIQIDMKVGNLTGIEKIYNDELNYIITNSNYTVIEPSKTISVQGTLNGMNEFLKTVKYIPSNNWNSYLNGVDVMTITLLVLNESQLFEPIIKTQITIYVEPVNDYPNIIFSNESLSFNESLIVNSYILPSMYVTDIDSVEDLYAIYSISMKVYFGSLSLNYTSGINITYQTEDMKYFAVNATLLNINRLLNNIYYTYPKRGILHDNFTLTVYDNGNHGNGIDSENLTVSKTVDITTYYINHPPDYVINNTMLKTDEDTRLILNNVVIDISDNEKDPLSFYIYAKYGSIRFNICDFKHDFITVMSGCGYEDRYIYMIGSSQALLRMVNEQAYFVSELNWNSYYRGYDTIYYGLTDKVMNLTEIPIIETQFVYVNPINDIPTITVNQSEYNIKNNEYYLINGISVDDVDINEGIYNLLTVNLTVSRGSIHLKYYEGLQFLSGSPIEYENYNNYTKSIIFRSTLLNINKAINSMKYKACSVCLGIDNITISVTDENTNEIELNDIKYGVSYLIKIYLLPSLNEPYIISPLTPYFIKEDTNQSLSDITIVDIDTLYYYLYVNITVDIGRIDGIKSNNNNDEDKDGNYNNIYIINSDIDTINNIIHSSNYIPPFNFNGLVTMTISVVDSDNLISPINYIYFHVLPVNDKPIINIINPLESLKIIKNTQTMFDFIEIDDVDSNEELNNWIIDSKYNNLITMNITSRDGNLTIINYPYPLINNETITINDNNKTVIFTNTIEYVKLLLSKIQYTPKYNSLDSDPIILSLNDNGNTGEGGVLIETTQFMMEIVNNTELPILNINDTMLNVDEDIPTLLFENFTLKDPNDFIGLFYYFRVGVKHGNITINSDNNNNNNNLKIANYFKNETGSYFEFRGTLKDINEMFNLLTYTNDLNYNNNWNYNIDKDTNKIYHDDFELLSIDISYDPNDLSKDNKIHKEVKVSVNWINDLPTIEGPNEFIMKDLEDTSLKGINITDVDFDEVENGYLTIQIYCENGNLEINNDIALSNAVKYQRIEKGYELIGYKNNQINKVISNIRYLSGGLPTDKLNIIVNDNGFSGDNNYLVKNRNKNNIVKKIIPIKVSRLDSTPSFYIENKNIVINQGETINLNVIPQYTGDTSYELQFTITSDILALSVDDSTLVSYPIYTDTNVTLSGTIENLQTIAKTVKYHCPSYYNSALYGRIMIYFKLKLIPGGDSILPVYDSISITVNPINTKPNIIFSNNNNITTNEDVPVLLDTIQISDNDLMNINNNSYNNIYSITLETIYGSLEVNNIAGLIAINDMSTNGKMVYLEGTIERINIALKNTYYIPQLHWNSVNRNSISNPIPDYLNITLNDNGNIGSIGENTDNSLISQFSIEIYVNSVNNCPTIYLSQKMIILDEDGSKNISNIIEINDVDVYQDFLILTISSIHLKLNLSTSNSKDKEIECNNCNNYNNFIQMRARLNEIQNSLRNQLSVLPNKDYNGIDFIYLSISEDNNNNNNNNCNITTALSVKINPINDRPIILYNNQYNIPRNNTLSITDIEIIDIDCTESPIGYLTLEIYTINNGLININLEEYNIIRIIEGNIENDTKLILEGRPNDLNKVLSSLKYIPTSNISIINDIIVMNISDNGFDGKDNTIYNNITYNISITIDNVYNPPEIITNIKYIITDEDEVLLLENNSIIIRDDNEMEVNTYILSLTVQQGVLQYYIPTSDKLLLTDYYYGNNVSEINYILSNVIYTPNLNYFGHDTLTIYIEKLPLDDNNNNNNNKVYNTLSIPISVTPVNDLPVITAISSNIISDTIEMNEKDHISISLNINDVDVDPIVNVNFFTVTLQCDLVLLSIFKVPNVQYVELNDHFVQFIAPIETCNLILKEISLFAPDGINGNSNLTITVNDNGYYGKVENNTNLDVIKVINITVLNVNSEPIITITNKYYTTERNDRIMITGTTIYDSDSNNNNQPVLMTITLSSQHGKICLMKDNSLLDFIVGDLKDCYKTIKFSTTDYSNIIDSFYYIPDTLYIGVDIITITANDNGYYGINGRVDGINNALESKEDIYIHCVDSITPSTTIIPEEMNVITNQIYDLNNIFIDVPVSPIQNEILSELVLGCKEGYFIHQSYYPGLYLPNYDEIKPKIVKIYGRLNDINNAIKNKNIIGYIVENRDVLSDRINITFNDKRYTSTPSVINVIITPACNKIEFITSKYYYDFEEDSSNQFTDISIKEFEGNNNNIDNIYLYIEVKCEHAILTFTSVSNYIYIIPPGKNQVKVYGKYNEVKDILNYLYYLPDKDFNGLDSINITINYNTISCKESNSLYLSIKVNPINDKPIINIPVNKYTLNNGKSLEINNVRIEDIDITDDSFYYQFTVSISCVYGNIKLLTMNGIRPINTNNNNNITFTGSLKYINQVIKRFIYISDPIYYGLDIITITVNDEGNIDSRSPKMKYIVNNTIEMTLLKTIHPLEVESLNKEYEIDENKDLLLSNMKINNYTENLIRLEVKFTYGNDKNNSIIKMMKMDGITVINNNNYSNIIIEGKYDDVLTSLNSIFYKPNTHWFGIVVLSYCITDKSIISVEKCTDIKIKVNPINDAPIIQYLNNNNNSIITIKEGESINLNDYIYVDDIDSNLNPNGRQIVTLECLCLLCEFEIIDNKNIIGLYKNIQHNSIILQGTIDVIQEAVKVLKYTPIPHYNGDDNITLILNDNGGYGKLSNSNSNFYEVPLSTTLIIPIKITAVNDPPFVIPPTNINVEIENEYYVFTVENTRINDYDLNENNNDDNNNFVLVNISCRYGVLSLFTDNGIIYINIDNNNNTLLFHSNLNDVNNAISIIKYSVLHKDMRNDDSIIITVNDNGYSGEGGIKEGKYEIYLNQHQIKLPSQINIPQYTIEGNQNEWINIPINITQKDNIINTNEIDNDRFIEVKIAAGNRGSLRCDRLKITSDHYNIIEDFYINCNGNYTLSILKDNEEKMNENNSVILPCNAKDMIYHETENITSIERGLKSLEILKNVTVIVKELNDYSKHYLITFNRANYDFPLITITAENENSTVNEYNVSYVDYKPRNGSFRLYYKDFYTRDIDINDINTDEFEEIIENDIPYINATIIEEVEYNVNDGSKEWKICYLSPTDSIVSLSVDTSKLNNLKMTIIPSEGNNRDVMTRVESITTVVTVKNPVQSLQLKGRKDNEFGYFRIVIDYTEINGMKYKTNLLTYDSSCMRFEDGINYKEDSLQDQIEKLPLNITINCNKQNPMKDYEDTIEWLVTFINAPVNFPLVTVEQIGNNNESKIEFKTYWIIHPIGIQDGYFQIGYNGHISLPIPFNATANEMKRSIELIEPTDSKIYNNEYNNVIVKRSKVNLLKGGSYTWIIYYLKRDPLFLTSLYVMNNKLIGDDPRVIINTINEGAIKHNKFELRKIGGFGYYNDNSEEVLHIEGNLKYINLALKNLYYKTDEFYYGDVDVYVYVRNKDNNNINSGEYDTVSVFPLSVKRINNIPSIYFPYNGLVTRENIQIYLSGIKITDYDSYYNYYELIVTSTIGYFIPPNNNNNNNNENNNKTIHYFGTFSSITNYLANTLYIPKPYWNGIDDLNLTIIDYTVMNDNENNTVSRIIPVVIKPVNDPPIVKYINQPMNIQEDLSFKLNDNILIIDPDDNEFTHKTMIMELNISSPHYYFTLNYNENGKILSTKTYNQSMIHISGPIDFINKALSTMTVNPQPNYCGSTVINVDVNDLGNFGEGKPEITNSKWYINVECVNDGPNIDLYRDVSICMAGVQYLKPIIINSNMIDCLEDIGCDTSYFNNKEYEYIINNYTDCVSKINLTGLSLIKQAKTIQYSCTPLVFNCTINSKPLTTVYCNEDQWCAIRGIHLSDFDMRYNNNNNTAISSSYYRMIFTVENGYININNTENLNIQMINNNNNNNNYKSYKLHLNKSIEVYHSFEINGTLEEINNAILYISYYSENNWNSDKHGFDKLNIIAIDNYNKINEKTVKIYVRAVNDIPNIVFDYPNITIDEDIPFYLDSVNVYDIDGEENPESIYTVNISSNYGSFNLTPLARIYHINNNIYNNVNPLIFDVRYKYLSEVIHLVEYQNILNYNGNDTIKIEVNDNGNKGLIGLETNLTTIGTNEITIIIKPVNDPPVVIVPKEMLYSFENQIMELPPIIIRDAEAINGSEIYNLVIEVQHGTISFESFNYYYNYINKNNKLNKTKENNFEKLIINKGSIINDKFMNITGPISVLNELFVFSTYQSEKFYNSYISLPDTITFTISEVENNENNNNYPLLSTSSIIYIHVEPVNNKPEIMAPYIHKKYNSDHNYLEVDYIETLNATEDIPFLIKNLYVIDLDAKETRNNVLDILLSVQHGILKTNSLFKISEFSSRFDPIITGSTIQYRGSLNSINRLIKTLYYIPSHNYNGKDNLHIYVNDNGYTGKITNNLFYENTHSIQCFNNTINDDYDYNKTIIMKYLVKNYLNYSDWNISDSYIESTPFTISASSEDVMVILNRLLKYSHLIPYYNNSEIGVTYVNRSDYLNTIQYCAHFNPNIKNLPELEIVSNYSSKVKIVKDYTITTTSLYDIVDIPIEIEAINDPPEFSIPAPIIQLEENKPVHLYGISLYDEETTPVDGMIYVKIFSENGKLTLNNVRNDERDKYYLKQTIILNYTISRINDYISDIIYTPNEDWNTDYKENETIIFTAYDDMKDLKNPRGTTEILSFIKVMGINSPPIIHIPGEIRANTNCTIQQNDPLPLEQRCDRIINLDTLKLNVTQNEIEQINNLYIIDTDGELYYGFKHTVEINCTYCILTLKTKHGLIFKDKTQDNSNRIIIEGSLTNINNAINGMYYSVNYKGIRSDFFNIFVSDNGNSGKGGILTDFVSLSVNITLVNSAPYFLPHSKNIIINEDELTLLPKMNVIDEDINYGLMNLEIEILHGYIRMEIDLYNLYYQSLTNKTNDYYYSENNVIKYCKHCSINGTIFDINNLLNNFYYISDMNYNSEIGEIEIIKLNISDFDKWNITYLYLNILPIDDSPVISKDNAIYSSKNRTEDNLSFKIEEIPLITIQEEEPVTITGISVREVDFKSEYSEYEVLECLIHSTNGNITINNYKPLLYGDVIHYNKSNVLIIEGDYRNTSNFQFRSNVNEMNILLSNITYKPYKYYDGFDKITIEVRNNNNNNRDRYDIMEINIFIESINEPPEIYIKKRVDGSKEFVVKENSSFVLPQINDYWNNFRNQTQPTTEGYELYKTHFINRRFDYSYDFELVKDIFKGENSSFPQDFIEFNGKIYFSAEDDIYGRELWVSDGTMSGTKLYYDLNPGVGSSDPSDFVIYNNKLYFTAYGNEMEYRLHDECDGYKTAQMNEDILFVASESNIWDINHIYDCPNNYHWMTTDEANLLFKNNLINGPDNEISAYYSQCGWNGYKYNNTERKYWRFSDSYINGSYKIGGYGESINIRYNLFDEKYFAGIICYKGEIECIEGEKCINYERNRVLWSTDGYNNKNTHKIITQRQSSPSFNPKNTIVFNNKLYFQASNPKYGNELFVSDGTEINTKIIADINPGYKSSNPENLRTNNNNLYFTAIKDNKRRLYCYTEDDDYYIISEDGDTVKEILTVENKNKIFFQNYDNETGIELYVFDEDDNSTYPITDINEDYGDTNPYSLLYYKDYIYFFGSNGLTIELYRININKIVKDEEGETEPEQISKFEKQPTNSPIPKYLTIFENNVTKMELMFVMNNKQNGRISNFYKVYKNEVSLIYRDSLGEILVNNYNNINENPFIKYKDALYITGRRYNVNDFDNNNYISRKLQDNENYPSLQSIVVFDPDAKVDDDLLYFHLYCKKCYIELSNYKNLEILNNDDKENIMMSNSIEFKSTLNAANKAFERVIYKAKENEIDEDELVIVVNDLGHNGMNNKENVVEERIMVEILSSDVNHDFDYDYE